MRAVAKSDLMVVVTSVGTEEQALDVAHALVRSRRGGEGSESCSASHLIAKKEVGGGGGS